MGPDFHRDLAFFRHRGRCASTLTRVGRRLIIASLVEEEERKKKGKKKEESFRTTVCIPVTVDRASSPPYLYHRLIMDHYPTRFVRRLNEPGMPEYESADVFTDYSKASLSLSFYLSLSRARAGAQTCASRCCARGLCCCESLVVAFFHGDATKRGRELLIIGGRGFRKSIGPRCPSR